MRSSMHLHAHQFVMLHVAEKGLVRRIWKGQPGGGGGGKKKKDKRKKLRTKYRSWDFMSK